MEPELHTVLVPGLACSARLWNTLLPAVWARGAVTIPDTRRDDTITGMAQRLLSDAPPRFALAGISMGGYICLEVMRIAPERVSRLALISTSAAPDTPEQRHNRQLQAAMARAGRFDDLVNAAFPILVDASDRDNQDLKDLWSTMAHEVGVEVFLTQLQAVIDRPDARDILPTIACPTAVIHGTDDQTIPVNNAHDTAAGIPNAQLTVLDHAGHMAAQERAADVSSAFTAILDQTTSPQHPSANSTVSK